VNWDLDREAKAVEIAGAQADVKAAVQELTNHLNELQKFVKTRKVRQYNVTAIIGSGGKTIQDIQRKTNTEIHIDRDSSVVTVFSPAMNEADLTAALAQIEALDVA